MFKNNVFEVRMKKDNKNETSSDVPAPTVEEVTASLTANAIALIQIGGKNVLKLAAAYVVLDTARQIAIARLSK